MSDDFDFVLINLDFYIGIALIDLETASKDFILTSLTALTLIRVSTRIIRNPRRLFHFGRLFWPHDRFY